jgi:hypothetical protein
MTRIGLFVLVSAISVCTCVAGTNPGSSLIIAQSQSIFAPGIVRPLQHSRIPVTIETGSPKTILLYDDETKKFAVEAIGGKVNGLRLSMNW